MMTEQTPPLSSSAAALSWLRAARRPAWWWLAPLSVLAVVGYVAVGMALAHVIDDDFEFGPGTVDSSQSRAVAIAARLVFREVDQHKWTANDPFYLPSWWLDNMPHFQQGIIAATARFTAA